MEEISLQDIYNEFAGRLENNFPPNNPGQITADAELYRNILPFFQDALLRKLQEIVQTNPGELKTNLEIAASLLSRFEGTFAPF
jgi:hypothetical protein